MRLDARDGKAARLVDHRPDVVRVDGADRTIAPALNETVLRLLGRGVAGIAQTEVERRRPPSPSLGARILVDVGRHARGEGRGGALLDLIAPTMAPCLVV